MFFKKLSIDVKNGNLLAPLGGGGVDGGQLFNLKWEGASC